MKNTEIKLLKNRSLFSLAVILVIPLAGCGGKVHQHELLVEDPGEAAAVVVIIRSGKEKFNNPYTGGKMITLPGIPAPLEITANGKKLLSLKKENYAVIRMKPGKTNLFVEDLASGSVVETPPPRLTANVPAKFWFEAGQTYFIHLKIGTQIHPLLESRSQQLYELGFAVPEGRDGRVSNPAYPQLPAKSRFIPSLIEIEEAAHLIRRTRPMEEAMAFDTSAVGAFIEPVAETGYQFQINRPDEKKWTIGKKDQSLRCERNFPAMEAQAQSATLMIESVVTRGSSPLRFAGVIKKELTEKEGGALTEFKSYEAPCEGRPCVRYDWVAQSSETDTTREGHGYLFLHPREGGVVMVHLFYTQTYAQGTSPVNLEAEINPVIRSLRFE